MKNKEGNNKGPALKDGGWQGEQSHLPEKSGFEVREETPPEKKLTDAETERKVRERFFN